MSLSIRPSNKGLIAVLSILVSIQLEFSGGLVRSGGTGSLPGMIRSHFLVTEYGRPWDSTATQIPRPFGQHQRQRQCPTVERLLFHSTRGFEIDGNAGRETVRQRHAGAARPTIAHDADADSNILEHHCRGNGLREVNFPANS